MHFKGRMILVIAAVLVMFALHNSFWLWDLDARAPVLFGFMPFAFYYYLGYALLACLVILLVIKLAWPDPPPGIFEHTGHKEGERKELDINEEALERRSGS